MTDDKNGWVYDEHEREKAEVRRRLSGILTPEEAKRRRDEESPAESLAPLLALAEKVRLRMASTVCEGHRDNVGKCYHLVERECSEKASSNCPKRVLEWEAKTARFKGPPPDTVQIFQGFGIPWAIAVLLASGSLEERPAMQLVSEWWEAKPRPRVLVLNGYTQIGKSVAAANLVSRFSGKFVNVPTELATRLRDDSYIRTLLLPSLLVFDDLGLERLDGFDEFKARFDGLLCARVDGGSFTVITTNAGNSIRSRYGDRVAERIAKHGWAKDIAEAA